MLQKQLLRILHLFLCTNHLKALKTGKDCVIIFFIGAAT